MTTSPAVAPLRTQAVGSADGDYARALGLTLGELSEIHARLREETARLHDLVARATLHVLDQSNVSARDLPDEIDEGVLQASLNADTELAEVCIRVLAQSEHAMRRLEAGTYGTCELCHEGIGPRRLLALARATTCVGCQSKVDRSAAAR